MFAILFLLTLSFSGANDFSQLNPILDDSSHVVAVLKDKIRDHAPFVDTDDITTEDNFGTQMNAILQDFPNQFINVKSLPMTDSDTFPIPRFYSHIQLGYSYYMYIQDEQPSSHATFQADFPGSTVPDFALRSYNQLRDNFMYYAFSCGSFTRGEELVDGYKRSQLYQINIATDKSNLAFQDMLVEIGIAQGRTVGGPGNEEIVWVPFLKVYGKG